MNQDFAIGTYEFEDYMKQLVEITDFDLNRKKEMDYFNSKDEDYPIGIPLATHLPTLNRWLDGGLYDGEVGIVMAQTGFGKSQFLVNIAAAACLIGKTAFYYTLELSDTQFRMRFDARFSGYTYCEQKERPGKKTERVKKVCGRGGNLIIQEYPSNEITVAGIVGHINQMKIKRGLHPDVVCIDYIDVVKPFSATDDDWMAIGKITGAIRGQIASKLKTRVWTGGQVKTEAYDRRVGLGEGRRSAEKNNIADVVLSMYQSKEPDTLILEGLKFRRSAQPIVPYIRIKKDFSRGAMEEVTPLVPSKKDVGGVL
jgi:replicative DNA helicase